MSPSETAGTQKSRATLLRFAAAFAVLLAVAGYVVTQFATSGSGPARCTIGSTGGEAPDYEIEPEQAANAATITAVASQRGLPERAATIALATAMQESMLRNIEHGDRDSLGLFQQRPSQGWGTGREILDPVYSSGKFYDHLVKIPGYSRLPLTVAAQRVQRSGFPQAYAKHETRAQQLASALTGKRAAALSCTTGPDGAPVQAGSPQLLTDRLQREFGTRVAVAASGERGGAGTAASEVRLPAQPSRRGWELAHWAVAHARSLRIAEVGYGNLVWHASRSQDGWTEREDSRGAPGTVTMRLSAGQSEK